MPRMTVVATEHPVPLPDGRTVRTRAEAPEGTNVEVDLFIRRRMDAGELEELKADQAPATAPKLTRPDKEG